MTLIVPSLQKKVLVTSSMKDEWETFKKFWKGCTQCPLHHKTKPVVHLRGKIPAKVLFIGEAPGESENVTGMPFTGPSGDMLNDIITEALEKLDNENQKTISHPSPLTFAFANLVGCMPWEDGGIRQPNKKEIQQCKSHLFEIVMMVNPMLVVLCGLLPEKHFPHGEYPFGVMSVQHPSSILRMDDDEEKELAFKKSYLRLYNRLRSST